MGKVCKVFLVFNLLLIGPVSVSAIVNIESQRTSEEVRGFEGKASLKTNAKGGNSEKENLGIESRLDWKKTESYQFLILSYEYGESAKVKDANKFFSHLRSVHRWDEVKSVEFFAQISSDEFTRLVYKGLLGGGLRWVLGKKGGAFESSLGTGAFYAHEKLDDRLPTDKNKEEKIVRANLYLNMIWVINERSKLVNTIYFQPHLGDVDDYYLLDQMSLNVKISDAFSFKWSFDLAKDSQPADEVKATDWAYQTAIEYQF